MQNKRTWAEIDLGAISANIGIIRDRIGPAVKLMAVVKADGYGHSALKSSQAALRGGADLLGVAICQEGFMLRKNGISAPILVLGHTPETLFDRALQSCLTLSVSEPDSAYQLARRAKKIGVTATIHIKLDTGMSRLGFSDCDADIDTVAKICGLTGICAEGIFTHFADASDRAFTYNQAKRFEIFIDELTRRGIDFKLKHAASSAATLLNPEFHYNMVRIGIAMYGLSPEPDFNLPELRPALSLKSLVSQVRKIASGVSVGYGRKFIANRETSVATVPIGYADGYSRGLGGKAFVLIRGTRAPVIGNVCMDQLMVDITDIDDGNIYPGETVTLIGQDGDCHIFADELAKLLGTINYEIVSGIGKRVPRLYKT